MAKRLMRGFTEFGVSPDTDWRRKGPSGGLGQGYSYLGSPPRFKSTGEYDPSIMSFTLSTGGKHWHIDYIAQDDAYADYAWSTFILDKSEGFTEAGVKRLNDGI